MKRIKTNITSVSNRFIGRQTDLNALHAHLSAHSLVTVIGAPGVGKTRICLEYATRIETFSQIHIDNIWFCDLTEAQSAEDICFSLGRVLDISFSSGNKITELVDQLSNTLNMRGQSLIILDNFEQLVPYAQQTLEVWRKETQNLSFLVTSRAALQLPNEVLFDLFPLSLPKEQQTPLESEAVQLFVERAKTVRRTFALTKDNTETIVKLVKELDGLPLAIELAVTRLRVFTPLQILENLDQRFQLLAKISNPKHDRQSTLYRIIDFSWHLLTPYEQSAFMQCAVFRGGFSLQAAEQVIDLSRYPEAGWIPDVLQSICDKSLLFTYEPEGAPEQRRFGLYLSIREYAQQRLEESGQQTEVEARHTRCFLQRSQAWEEKEGNDRERESTKEFALEVENLLSIHRRALQIPNASKERLEEALQIALAVNHLFFLQGLYGFCFSLVDSVLKAPAAKEITPKLLSKALRSRGYLSSLLGQTKEGFADLEAARKLAEKIGDQKLLACVLSSLGILFFSQHKLTEAKALQEQALEIFCKIKSSYFEGITRNRLAVILMEECKVEEAKNYYEKAVVLHRKVGNRMDEAVTLGNLGNLYLDQGFSEKAQGYYKRALPILRELNNRHAEGILACNFANIEREKGNVVGAKTHLEHGLHIARETGYQELEGMFLLLLGNCYQEENGYLNAKQCYQNALHIYQKLNQQILVGLSLAYLATLEAFVGNLIEAKELFTKGEEKLQDCESPIYISTLRICEGHLFLAAAKQVPTNSPKAIDSRKKVQEILLAPQILSLSERNIEVRLALNYLKRLLETIEKPSHALQESPLPETSQSSFQKHLLVVANDGKWFRLPSGEKISLHRRKSLCLILQALIKQRVEKPNVPLSLDKLLESGWPGERIHFEVRKNRVYTAVARLRDLGLQNVLTRFEDGYLLDPSLSIVSD